MFIVFCPQCKKAIRERPFEFKPFEKNEFDCRNCQLNFELLQVEADQPLDKTKKNDGVLFDLFMLIGEHDFKDPDKNASGFGNFEISKVLNCPLCTEPVQNKSLTIVEGIVGTEPIKCRSCGALYDVELDFST